MADEDVVRDMTPKEDVVKETSPPAETPSDAAKIQAAAGVEETTGDPDVDEQIRNEIESGIYANWEAAVAARESMKPAEGAGATKAQDVRDDPLGHQEPGDGRP